MASQQPPMAPSEPAQSAVLTKSLFSKDGRGSISEDDLQTVLGTPIDLVFPARVGVVPLGEPFDSEGEVGLTLRSVASQNFADRIARSEHFSHVSDISTDLPNVGGLEGLRAIAARYRLRYLLLYSERFEDDTHLNGWAALYPTIIGMFVAPGVTVQSRGIAQVDLLDVRTGTILFTAVEPMEVSSNELMTAAPRAHLEEQHAAATKAAQRLAKKVHGQMNAMIAYAESAQKTDAIAARVLPAPIADEALLQAKAMPTPRAVELPAPIEPAESQP